MIKKLTPDELRYIHDTMLNKYGGLTGEKSPG